MEKIAIIGGGAAGLACAVAAASSLRAAGSAAEVVVFERDDRVGRSILATGNGRCNFSNAVIDPGVYRNGAFVAEVLCALEGVCETDAGGQPVSSAAQVAPDAVHGFFAGLGLAWREEQDGRQYPLANKASAVLDVLRARARQLGVQEACERTVALVDPPHAGSEKFTLRMADGVFERADAVIVACGGKAAAKLQVANWPQPAMRPVLGPLATDTAAIKELNNIRVRARVSLLRPGEPEGEALAVEQGEVMFRKYGVSGIAVFNLSRFAQPGDVLSLNFLNELCAPGDEAAYCAQRAQGLQQGLGKGATANNFLCGLVLPLVAQALLRCAGVSADQPLDSETVAKLARVLTGFPLTVRGIGDADNCQVQRGGYDVGLVNAGTMQASKIPGLYLAGEALDIDAPCGGFNLHWAWASGMLAGTSAAQCLVAGGSNGTGAAQGPASGSAAAVSNPRNPENPCDL